LIFDRSVLTNLKFLLLPVVVYDVGLCVCPVKLLTLTFDRLTSELVLSNTWHGQPLHQLGLSKPFLRFPVNWRHAEQTQMRYWW